LIKLEFCLRLGKVSDSNLNSIYSSPLKMALSKYWNAYLHELEANPVPTKSLTSATTSILSNILVQIMQGTSLTKLDLTSIRNQAIVGLISGALTHYWYLILEDLFNHLQLNQHGKANSLTTVLGKVFVDQTTFGPLFNLLYFYEIGLLEGRSLSYINEKVGKEYSSVMMANYKIWPLLNIINFKLVPPNMRVLFGNVASILWTAYVIKLTRK